MRNRFMCTYLPKSSEKLIPSLNFPPTTQNINAPVNPVSLTPVCVLNYKKNRQTDRRQLNGQTDRQMDK